jgi:hypothetical protein
VTVKILEDKRLLINQQRCLPKGQIIVTLRICAFPFVLVNSRCQKSWNCWAYCSVLQVKLVLAIPLFTMGDGASDSSYYLVSHDLPPLLCNCTPQSTSDTCLCACNSYCCLRSRSVTVTCCKPMLVADPSLRMAAEDAVEALQSAFEVAERVGGVVTMRARNKVGTTQI